MDRVGRTMNVQTLASDIELRSAAVRDPLVEAVCKHGRGTYAHSTGAEAMVLTDIICTAVPSIDIFSIDTGRLHQETHDLLDRLRRRYGPRIRVVCPDARALEALVNAPGTNGFYDSLEARLACC